MINWGHFIGNLDRKEVASMWSASLGFVPTQGCTSWLLWYLRFILLKRVNRREWSGWKCLYKRAEWHWQKNKRPDSTPMIGPILSTMGLCKVVWEGKQGEWEGAVFSVSIPVFPRLHFHPSHGTTLVTPLFPLPSPFCPLRQRAGGSIEFPLQLKGYFSPSLGWKDDYFPPRLPSDSFLFVFFLRWEARGRKETITCGVKGGLETQPCPVCRGRKRIGMRDWMGEKPEISGNGWEWPKKNFRHPRLVLSCRKVFPIMVSVCYKTAGRSLKARDSDKHVWKHENTESTLRSGTKNKFIYD